MKINSIFAKTIKPIQYNISNIKNSISFSFKGCEEQNDVFLLEQKTTKTEREKQLSGEFYYSGDSELRTLQKNSRKLMREFNATDEYIEKQDIMKKWFKSVGERSFIEGNFFCDFGCNLSLGNNVYINTGCTILDSAEVKIGDNTMIAPGVKICTASHSVIPEERLKREKVYAKPVTIGKDCWICAGAIILPGVTIGDGSTIGAGSVVTSDVPPRCIAVGIPCKRIKDIPKC